MTSIVLHYFEKWCREEVSTRFTDHREPNKVDEIPYGHSYLSPRLWGDTWPLFSSLGLLGC